jgi:hypothetical protein
MYSLEVSKANSNYIYAASFGHIYKTPDGGTTWSDITGTLPVSQCAISGITSSSSNADHVWVTFSGFSQGNKVFYSSDGGTTWTNISAGLPNIPANCIKYQNGSNDFVYAGTDLGVFFYDNSLSSWVPFNAGLPNAIVLDLEMYYPANKIRCATFGRGIWESDFHDSTVATGNSEINFNAFVNVYPNPSADGKFQVSSSKSQISSIEVYNSVGQKVFSGSVNKKEETFFLDEAPGIYFLKIQTGKETVFRKLVLK